MEEPLAPEEVLLRFKKIIGRDMTPDEKHKFSCRPALPKLSTNETSSTNEPTTTNPSNAKDATAVMVVCLSSLALGFSRRSRTAEAEAVQRQLYVLHRGRRNEPRRIVLQIAPRTDRQSTSPDFSA